MAFNVDQFRAVMASDGARPNLFQVDLAFPAGIRAVGMAQRLTFTAHAAQLPGSTLGVARQYYFGREVKFAGNRVFQDWAISVINDEQFLVRNVLEAWSNAINSHETNIRRADFVPAINGYAVDGMITQFTKDGLPSKQYEFVGMFPVSIDPINVSWDSNDRIEEYGVTFSYQYWNAYDMNNNKVTT
jgi:hypothetical protein